MALDRRENLLSSPYLLVSRGKKRVWWKVEVFAKKINLHGVRCLELEFPLLSVGINIITHLLSDNCFLLL